MTAQSTQLVTEGAIPTQVTELQLNLLGGEEDKVDIHSTTSATISSIPLSESRALPLEDPPNLNPPDWPHLRGMPRYTPFEQNINRADRPLGKNGGELTFLILMLSGVQIVGTGNRIWRSTVGRVKDDVFQYKIGGHW
ncbi:hypothetical protein CI109_104425 [Kwoniella shandongensis]|uniref:Uncharacterized protein n=1 Tax=Kwoniella shandongensis TaxID=1734106 RepID=A0A5M6C192_9TREE|nr:uncharacterized protein CI109_004177 [Kwoniella shandongensis]KAA5527365.1 hypothetical protein CI109_004177 [Kwoniella shandongensis]